MNIQQSQNSFNVAKQFDSIEFDKQISDLYPGRTDLDSIQLPYMSLAEFVYLAKHIFERFVFVLEKREITLILPYSFTQPQVGTAAIDSQLLNFLNQIKANNIDGAASILLWLTSYQVEHGIFGKQMSKKNNEIENSIGILTEKLNLIQTSILNKQKEVDKQYSDLDSTKKDIQNFIVQKRDELNQITTNLNTSNTQSNQINELLTRSTEQNSRLNTILEQQELNKTQFDKQRDNFLALYLGTKEQLDENIKTASLKIDEFQNQILANEEHLKFVEGKRDFFEERNKYLEELIGREVGASLFETFKQRKIELHKPVVFWQWAVPIMAGATIFWIVLLFGFAPPTTDLTSWWQMFAVNSLKSIPAIFLLLFSISQYGRERNFQEEYAFKSAVALTIKAYANQLEDAKNKDSLIMEAVLNIYKTPIEERSSRKIKNKKLFEAIKTIVDTTKDLAKK